MFVSDNSDGYRPDACSRCGRNRVQSDGVCEKCLWDNDAQQFASISRPDSYDTHGPVFIDPNSGTTLSGGINR